MAGLTNTGFSKKSFEDLKSDTEARLVNAFGKVNLNAPSVFTQLNSIVAVELAYVWEALEAIYNSQYPSTAEGLSLDGVCAYNGLIRLKATYSTALCQLTAINYTTIPQYSEIVVENTDNVFSLNQSITVTNEKCYSITLQVTTNNTAEYKVIINNTEYSYTFQDADDEIKIATALVTKINAVNLNFTAETEEDLIYITSKDVLTTFSCFVSETLEIIDCTNNAIFIAKQVGDIKAPSFSLNLIQTPVQGWISVNNLNSAIVGRNLESDLELRLRRERSIRLSGSGTIEAITARILNIKGVTAVTVVENNTMVTGAAGRPPKSFEALVTGGNDIQVAMAIWYTKPAGIEAYGSKSVQITDGSGIKQIVKFSRPVNIYIYIDIKLKVNDRFNNSSIEIIKNNIANKINSLGVNSDIICQALIAVVYSEQGVRDAEIKIGNTKAEESPPSGKSSENIPIGAAEVAITDASKITVTVTAI